MMSRKQKLRFIAYKSPDPMLSPKIKHDDDLASLLRHLGDIGYKPSVFGPAIYYVPFGKFKHTKFCAVGIGTWVGGMKIRLFEFADPPPAPGVEFVRQIEIWEDEDE